MRRALLAAVAVLLGSAPSADAKPITCRSGFTMAEGPGLRVFGAYTGEDLGLYTCVKGRPHRFWQVSPATTPASIAYARYGRRLAFSLEEYSDGGNGIWVGWIDVPTGRTSLRSVSGPKVPEDPDASSDFTPPPDTVAVGPKGEVAWAYAAGNDTYEVFWRRAKGRDHRIAVVPRDQLELATLAVRGRKVTWRTLGEPRSVPLAPAAPAPAATTAARRPRCNTGSVLYADDSARVFRVGSGVYACGKRAVRIAKPKAKLRFAHERRVLAFAERGRIGTLQLRDRVLRTRALAGPRPSVMSPGADGGLAIFRGGLLSYLPVAGSRLGPPRTLAQLGPGELDRYTLDVGRAAVTWRTVGERRRALAPA